MTTIRLMSDFGLYPFYVDSGDGFELTDPPEFQQEYLQARREVLSQSLARLQQGSSAAVATLLKIMAGVDDNHDGEVIRMPGIKVGYLEQEPGLGAGKTVRETVEEALGDVAAAKKRLEEVYAAYAAAVRQAQRRARALRTGASPPPPETRRGLSAESPCARCTRGIRTNVCGLPALGPSPARKPASGRARSPRGKSPDELF